MFRATGEGRFNRNKEKKKEKHARGRKGCKAINPKPLTRGEESTDGDGSGTSINFFAGYKHAASGAVIGHW